jgi:hypothetical protein
MHTPEEIKKALQDGIDAGKHDATPGNLFRSAWLAAKDYGYHGLLHGIFTTGYLSELPPDGVLVDSNSVVVGGPQYQKPAEWSGSECPVDPDGCWIDDETEEHVNAKTAERTANHPAR